MNNIIGLNTRLYGSNLNIAPAVESQEEEQVEETTPERVLNPIVSESYMRKYVEEHGGGSKKVVYIPEQTVIFSNTSPVVEINTNLDPENPVESIPLSMEVGSEKANFTLTYGFHQGIGSNSYYFADESTLISVPYDDDEGKWYCIFLQSHQPLGDLEVTISSIAEESESASQFNLRKLEVEFSQNIEGEAEIKIDGCFYNEESKTFYSNFYATNSMSADELEADIAIPVDGEMLAYISIITGSSIGETMTGSVTYDEHNQQYAVTGNCRVFVSITK